MTLAVIATVVAVGSFAGWQFANLADMIRRRETK